MIPVFLGTTFLIYWLVWSLPGDRLAGKCKGPCPPAYVEKMTEKYNLDENVFVQYFSYLGNLLQGDFGVTFEDREVSMLIEAAAPVSLKLALVAIIIEALIGIAAGILTGLRGRGFLDNLVLVSTLVLIAFPVFVTGFAVKQIFGDWLGVIDLTVGSDPTIAELIAPGFVLGSLSMAYVARLTRTSIIENKRADYVRTALAKGQPQTRVVGVHLLRNSIIPVITFLGTDLGSLMGGAIVTEGIFRINGVGGLIYDSVLTREGTIVTGVVMLLVLIFLMMNLIIDLLYAVLDPRIRYE